MVYIVLGMHKSGTTLVSQILHESGINMGEFDINISYDKGNKYERFEKIHLNYDIMQLNYGQFSLSVLKIVNNPDMVPENVKDKIKSIINNLNETYNEWGFKDPKTCLTYSIWKNFIPNHKVIVVFRHPIELWFHYKPKHLKDIFFSPIICWKVIKAWHLYNEQILIHLKNSPDSDKIIFEYSDFMEYDYIFQYLQEFTKKQLKDCRDNKLYRNKKNESNLFRIIALLQKIITSRDVFNLYNQLKQQKLKIEKSK